MSAEPAAGIAAWVLDVIARLGYVGVAVLVALDNVFPPIPSEVILPLAGFVTGQGQLAYPGVVAAATVGSVAGALPLYALGRGLGEARLRGFVGRFGRWLFVKEDDLDRAQAWFDRHGPWAVLLGRCVPFIRSMISIPAGLARMSLGPFVAYTAVGSAIWNATLVGLGWFLGDRWEEIGQYVGILGDLARVALLAAVVGFVAHRLRAHLRRRGTPG